MMRFLAFVLALLLAGCSEPEIDKEKSKESLSKVKSSLSSEKLQEFEEAWKTVAMSAFSDAMKQSLSGDVDADHAPDAFLERMDGMTADEVISYADSIKRAKKRQERRQAIQEIKELREQRKSAMAAEGSLSQFEVVRSRFYKREERFGRDQPIVELTVKNNTNHAISRAFFEAELRSPDREVPWLKDKFNYEISGGVEPGERQEWSLAPNQFSDWGSVEERNDMVLIVEPYKLEGPDGETLYEADWSEEDEERLQTLVEGYGEYLEN